MDCYLWIAGSCLVKKRKTERMDDDPHINHCDCLCSYLWGSGFMSNTDVLVPKLLTYKSHPQS